MLVTLFFAFFVVKVPASPLLHDQFLAGDAVTAPRDRGQPINADLLSAMEALAECAIVDAANRRFHQLQQSAFLRLLPESHFL